jgi:hypothetical protein
MDVLNALICKADAWSLLNLIGIRAIPFKTSLYIDDIIMFISPVAGNLHTIKVIFDGFHGASGLACNIQKSQMVPIHCSEEDIALAQTIFPCQLSSSPLTYLGLPLLVIALPHRTFQPLIDRMADRLPT